MRTRRRGADLGERRVARTPRFAGLVERVFFMGAAFDFFLWLCAPASCGLHFQPNDAQMRNKMNAGAASAKLLRWGVPAPATTSE
jgi:hypothetical protein